MLKNIELSNNPCNKCKHFGVCKHEDNMKKYQNEIDEIKSNNNLYSNFNIIIKCKHYMDDNTLLPIMRRTTNE